ncbi:MAG: GNAT family N-acetyltransferase [Anaerolineae bacterium]|nr:GNAT family N-acetyltransferase [Phycisphaerae bacterium]
MRIRLATIADIDALTDLIPRAARELSKGFYTPAQIDRAVGHVYGVDRQLIADGTYLVAEVDNYVAGCGGWSKRKTMFGGDGTGFKDKTDALLDPKRDAARIRAFFVHPGFARRGIGRAILQTCERAAREAGFTKLELVATLPGEPLYTACGYRRIEPLDIPIPDGSILPAIKMAKDLTATH